MSASTQTLDAAAAVDLIPSRDPRSHKGTYGTVVVVAGSLDYAGAALLCSLAATRAGAGLVCLAVPAALQPIVAGRVPEAITMALPETAPMEVAPEKAAERIAEREADALIVGPGLAATDGNAELVRKLVASPGPPLVADAEALNVLSVTADWWVAVQRTLVVTPHPGEFARLDGRPVGPDDDERASRAQLAADRWSCTVVLKGAHTVVATRNKRAVQSVWANAALATAGTGDVLAGTIGALLAQRMTAFDAARLGVYLHGAAAAKASERIGDSGLLASDLPLLIAQVRHEMAGTKAASL